MIERRKKELDLVIRVADEVEIDPSLNWFIIKQYPLGNGWNKPEISVLILIPSGYPTTPPDNFYTDPDLRLAQGAQPNRATPCVQIGKQWLQFSYHVEKGDWQPHAEVSKGHNLLTFLDGVKQRLTEVD